MNKKNAGAKPAALKPEDVVDLEARIGSVRAALWTDGRLVLEGLAGRMRPDGSIELTPEETMQVARLTSSLIFI